MSLKQQWRELSTFECSAAQLMIQYCKWICSDWENRNAIWCWWKKLIKLKLIVMKIWFSHYKLWQLHVVAELSSCCSIKWIGSTEHTTFCNVRELKWRRWWRRRQRRRPLFISAILHLMSTQFFLGNCNLDFITRFIFFFFCLKI